MHLASRSFSAVAPLLDTVDGLYLSEDGLRATMEAAAVCADEINGVLQGGTPIDALHVGVSLSRLKSTSRRLCARFVEQSMKIRCDDYGQRV